MEKISIIGCGTMGHSIAISIAWAGSNVNIYGINDTDVEKANKSLAFKLNVMVENEVFTKELAESIKKKIIFFTSLEETVADSTFIIEAIPEILELKQDMYKQLEALVDENVVIASNTSGLQPSLLSEKMDHKERFLITHFWNPAHLIPLVEVVKTSFTNEDVVERTMQLLIEINKKPIKLNREIPGFIGNRLQFALYREAQSLYEAGVASKEDIDAAVTYSIGRRLPASGPLLSADMTGLECCTIDFELLIRRFK
ncbi:3-hydroxyacyl-CoA dehydrogenase family protein [Rummeliibacillus sp. JY-2-4R]